MAQDYDLLDVRIQRIDGEVSRLKIKIDGDRSVVNGGGTGLLGKVERLQTAFYTFEDDVREVSGELRRLRDEVTATGLKRQAQIDQLSRQVDDINARLVPRWWNVVIVAGGFCIIALLAIKLLELSGAIGG